MLNILDYAKQAIARAEQISVTGDIDQVFRELRHLPLDDFADLLLQMPDKELPHLSTVLPGMAAEDVQTLWTGTSGYSLLRQTLAFVKSLEYHMHLYNRGGLADKLVLDFGCGYGRIVRLLYYFTSPRLIYGVDPWDAAIDLCRRSRLLGTFRQSDYLPQDLPVGPMQFDVIYAFSVFTHLSERAAQMALTALRRHIKPSGLLALTVRPVEYWTLAEERGAIRTAEHLIEAHRNRGFAFEPHERPPVDGDITYGDTSMSVDYLGGTRSDWLLTGYDRSLDDAYQLILFLKPV